jgi:hypothetical protein
MPHIRHSPYDESKFVKASSEETVMSEPYGPPGGYPNQPPPWQQSGAGQGPSQPVSGGGTAPGYPPQYGAPQPQQPYDAPYAQPSYGTQQTQPSYGRGQAQPPYGTQPAQPSYGGGQAQPGYGAIPGQPPYGYPQPQAPYGAAQPQAPYGAAQPQQPYGAVQPQAPYGAMPGQPPYGAPEQRRSRGPLIAIIAVVAVLLIGGITAAVAIGASGDDENRAGSSSTTGSGGNSTGGGSTGGGRNVTFNAPDKVGSLNKMSRQDQVDPMRDSLRAAGIDNPFAVAYEDSSDAHHTLIAWGGTGKAFEVGSAQSELDAFFKSAVTSIEGGSQGSVKKVDAGSLGGTAECADVSGLDQATSLCAWTNSEALLGFVFDGFSPSESQSHVRALLSALVTVD